MALEAFFMSTFLDCYTIIMKSWKSVKIKPKTPWKSVKIGLKIPWKSVKIQVKISWKNVIGRLERNDLWRCYAEFWRKDAEKKN